MFRHKLAFIAVVAVAALAGTVWAQAPADPPAGGPGGPGGGRGGRGGFMQRDAMVEYVGALAEANLRPDFTLTADQKTKIQAVRDDYKKARDEFRKANQTELDKIQTAMRDAAGDREKMRAAFQQRQDLMAKGPKADEYAAKIKAILTAEQTAQIEKTIKEIEEERAATFGGGGGGPGGPGAANGGAPGGGRRGGAGGGGRGGRGAPGGAPGAAPGGGN